MERDVDQDLVLRGEGVNPRVEVGDHPGEVLAGRGTIREPRLLHQHKYVKTWFAVEDILEFYSDS